ncbi:TPA: Ktr system potassium transporter B, partial [Candidatus Marinimicrobia bacterium]|nr:Ktr system potassium transporter B [Candidatus Neomarinimicrobiota bacterium]
LSTGITGDLSNTGKILIMILMFIGRLGPLTIGYALVFGSKPQNYTYAEERIMIG